jgi:hypothetical protein
MLIKTFAINQQYEKNPFSGDKQHTVAHVVQVGIFVHYFTYFTRQEVGLELG